MFDIKRIRENPKAFDSGLAKRGLDPQSSVLIEIDKKRREYQTRAQELQANRNQLSKKIGRAKASGENVSEEINEVSISKKQQLEAEVKAKATVADLDALMSEIPNIPMEDVPKGNNELDNIELCEWGTRPAFEFVPKGHVEIGEGLGMMDFETAAKISGSRFCILSDQLAQLERALGSFMLDLHVNEHGYIEVNPPGLVRDDAVFGTGQLPKFSEDLFRTDNGYWLIPTAEVPLTNLVSGDIVLEEELPKRYTAMTWCFRSEAGASGQDTHGMIRQHQFSKVELVSITTQEGSEDELERMTSCAEEVLKRLELPYRKMLLSAGDMGFSACKTYDIEVWLPGQNAGRGKYREISSCSLCGEFQARRMKARYRPKKEGAVLYVHTLNGSGIAIGRALIAILENNQQSDGSVVVPEVLRSYMNGLKVICSRS